VAPPNNVELTAASGPATTERFAPARPTFKSDRDLLDAYGKLPLAFVENQGQTDPRVRYFAHGSGYAFFLTRKEIVLLFVHRFASRAAIEPATHQIILALRFLGGNPDVALKGEERAPGEVNYFRGSDQARWQTQLPRYGQIVYRDLWPGVDMTLTGQGGKLKYEFHLRPGARPADIRLAYRGSSGLALDSAGALLIETSSGMLRDSPPVAYQEIGGARVPVESRYALNDGGSAGTSFGFAVGKGYDPKHELIIDPGVDYSTFLGGTSHEIGAGIAVDAAGNVYVVGTTQSLDFPATGGAFRTRLNSTTNVSDVFVSKLNATGSALIYSTYLGGSGFDFGRAIAVDAAGNAYVTGQTASSNFPTTGGAFQRAIKFIPTPRPPDPMDAFVTKLNSAGSGLVYSTFLGGVDIDDALGIAVDSAGNAYVTGVTSSHDFPTTPGAFSRTSGGGNDAFVTKLNATGTALVYSTYLGGLDNEVGARIRLDAANNAYVMGSTRSADFPTTAGAFDTTHNGAFDVFVTKVNATGSGLVYSTFLGGSDFDSGQGLAIDAAGNAYVSGGTLSLDFPTTPGAFSTTPSGSDAFVTKLNAAGSALVYSTFLGGTGGEGAAAIAVDAAGIAYVTGGTSSVDFPTTADGFQPRFNGGASDAFVTRLNATGSALLYSTFLGGTNSESGADLVLDAKGNAYVTGVTYSADFPTTPGALDVIFKGNTLIFWGDAFVTKFVFADVGLSISSLAVSPSTVAGRTSSTGTATLSAAAPAGGATVTLASSNPAVVGVPASVTVPAGAASTSFAITTTTVAASTALSISGTFGGVTRTAVLTVTPVAAAPSLSSVTVDPTSVVGGAGASGTVTLTAAAPASGAIVGLSSSNTTVASVPASATVAAGALSANFSIGTTAVTVATPVTISGTFGGATRTATLSVNPQVAPPPPPPPPAQSATLTVTATGRTGERVTSSPAGINVAVGSTGSATFATGTSITLTVSNGRSAIWSGACSSGANKVKTCTFTITGAASVSANVQ